MVVHAIKIERKEGGMWSGRIVCGMREWSGKALLTFEPRLAVSEGVNYADISGKSVLG